MKVRTFRLDIGPRDPEAVKTLIDAWLTKHSDVIHKYVISHEIATVTGKPHYQGIMYHADDVRFENVTRHWKDWKASEKSFAPVRDEESYRKYVTKDGNIAFIKGITQEEMDEWGTWEKQDKTKKQKSESRRMLQYQKFIEHCKSKETPQGGVYTLDFIARELFAFMATEPLPEQVNWFKGMIFSAQAVLMKNHPRNQKFISVEDEWVTRVLY